MRVVMLNTFDVGGGAAVATTRLAAGLRSMGVDARLLVGFRRGNAPDVIAPRGGFAGTLAAYARHELDRLPLRRYPGLGHSLFSPAMVPDGLARRVAGQSPDIVHLNWMGFGFCRIETLRRFNRPLVWTLHDSWPFTGGCYLPGECTRYREACGACPVLGSTDERDLSRRVWERKRRAWQGLNLTVVTPSRWLADCARSSSLFGDVRIEVIPNGLDLCRFRPMDQREAREKLGLPLDRKLVLFGAVDAASDPNKGFHLLLPALQRLAVDGWRDRLELAVFGSEEPLSPPDFGLPVRYMGKLDDEARIAMLYAAADLFAAPSLLENLSCMVMEAMACGTPCVAFDIGGMPDMIEHERNGYLARPYEPEDLARGIAWVLKDEGRHAELSSNARLKAEGAFAIEKVAARYRALYGELGVRSEERGTRTGKKPCSPNLEPLSL